MCILQMQVKCADKFLEILPEDIESAELMVENVVSSALLDIFDKVAVEEVTIGFPSTSQNRVQNTSILIRADCLSESFPLLPGAEEEMKQTLIKCVSSHLKELFGSVHIDSITLSPSPWDFEHDRALSHKM